MKKANNKVNISSFNKILNMIKSKVKLMYKEKKFNSLEVIILMIIGALISAIITTAIYNNACSITKYSKVNKNLQTLIDTYNEIINNYYGDIDENKIVNGGVKGMLNSVGDPYTAYMDDSVSSNFNITLNGSYEGLGIEISTMNNKLTIVGIFKNSAAEEAGLKLGDIIDSIDDKQASEMSSSDFSEYIRNSNDENFVLTITRDGSSKKIPIKKKTVILKSVSSKLLNDKKTGYIYVSIFASNTYEQFKEALDDLESKNINSLIIDLRDNTGGELTCASNMISLFLDKDKIMYQTEDKEENKKVYSYGNKNKEYPIVLLVNENSASASEIMTSALKENLNSIVIGKTTFGKGTVQTLLKTETGQQFKISTQKWLTPNGSWINEKGIEPDISVSLSDLYLENSIEENDSQLQAAIKYLKEH